MNIKLLKMHENLSLPVTSFAHGRRDWMSRTLAGALLLGASVATPAYAAEAYPTRPISLVIGYAPGGGTDIVGRVLALELEKELGQPVVVDNRPGAGTLIATQYVARAPADGYTLFFGTNGMVINSVMQEPSPYDVVSDFQPIGMVTVQALALVVRPGLKVGSVQELVNHAKKNPGKLNFASSGHGNAQHLAGEAFAQATEIEITHIPYKGAGPAIQDLIGGRVDMMFTGLLGLEEHIAEKRMVLVATTRAERTSATPAVSEAIPGYAVDSWQAVFAPAGTPEPVVEKLSAALQKIGRDGNLAKRFAPQGMEVEVSKPAELRDFLVQEREGLAGLVQYMKKD